MDEEELQKRFTDCVYFLASPLTCKKGIECEYRHSEIARLNPRDCWYWLGGSCFNPNCAFRHPPLEGFKEAYRESANPNNGPALPENKTNVPCYFYYNGFCNKGDRCSFLHGPADGCLAWKSPKAASMVNNAVPCEKKLSAGKNTGSAPGESHPDSSETAQLQYVHTESKPTQDSQQLASRSAERSETPDISATHCQETVGRSDSLLPWEESIQTEPDVSNDQSSDEQVDGYVEREGQLELSPGFDVLVEGESERLGYGEDAEYFPVHDEEGRELDVHHVEYNCADSIEYDPAYPELGNALREERYDVYDHLDNKQACDYLGKISGQSRESIFYRLSSRKRNLQSEPMFNGRRGADLREHLKKRKVVDDSFRSCISKEHDSPCLVDHKIRRDPRRHGFHGKLGIDHRGRLRKSVPVNRYRQPQRDKRPGKPHFLSSEVSRSRKPALQQKRKSLEESAIFTGPKTLDQIKEEKKKTLQNRGIPTSFNRTASDGFQGPRPLSEILKNKRKLGSVVDHSVNIN